MGTNRWRLDGQVALVTGASAGIGRAIAAELLELGADVMIVARDQDALDLAVDELEDQFPDADVRAFAADVSDTEQRREVFDWVEDLGEGLQLLVNNAGTNTSRPAMDYGDDEWRQIFETNLFSAFELSRFAFPLLSEHASSMYLPPRPAVTVHAFARPVIGANSTRSEALTSGAEAPNASPRIGP